LKNKDLIIVSLAFLASLIIIGLFLFYQLNSGFDKIKTKLNKQINDLRTVNLELVRENTSLKFEIQQQLAENYVIKTAEITGYAPLDPQAKEGLCYSGDPTITASGESTTPGITVAADSSIPFGTWIWIENLGWRRVDDRGGRIKGDRIDVCFLTQKQALNWGKRKGIIIIPEWRNES